MPGYFFFTKGIHMSELRLLLKPIVQHANLMLGWLTVPCPVQVSMEGQAIKELAWKLVKKFRLRKGDAVPYRITSHYSLDGRIKAAVGFILKQGYWNPTVRPYTGVLDEGFWLREQSYSRMIPLSWRDGAFRLAGDEVRGFHCVSPEILNKTTEGDYREDDKILFNLFKDTQPAFCSRGAERTRISEGAVIGKPWFRAKEDTEFNPEWVRSTRAEPEDLIGTELPAIALQSGHNEHFAHLQFFSKIVERDDEGTVRAIFNVNRPMDVMELRPQHFTKIAPKIQLHPDDFSETDQSASPEFFSGWRHSQLQK